VNIAGAAIADVDVVVSRERYRRIDLVATTSSAAAAAAEPVPDRPHGGLVQALFEAVLPC